MACVADVHEPWIGPGYSTYDADKIAKIQGVDLEAWLMELERATIERGGTVVYEGDPEKRPKWLQRALAAAHRRDK